MTRSQTRIPYSVLDLSPVPEGATTAEALANTLDLAQHAEDWGYARYWLAEHHNMEGIASAATSVVIGHVAAGTRKIRVGAGGVMLPNHAPLMIAEQFGTLATLFPDRIDLGLGRAPGTDGATAQALRRNMGGGDTFPQDVMELIGFFGPRAEGQRVRAVPGVGTEVPVWILGSSLYGAQLAAYLGLPYAFASHFAPGDLAEAVEIYRSRFQPSANADKPHFMLAINVFAADTDAEAKLLRSSMQQAFINLRTGKPGKLPRPMANLESQVDPAMLRMVNQALSVTAVGSPESVQSQLQALISRYRPDEVILTGQIHDHAARLKSFRIASEVMQGIALPEAAAAE
jgi:luciferase family oxidoreductase group 1